MPSPLNIPVDELLALVEAAAASGDRRAGLLIDRLIEEEQRTGELGVISRLATKPHIPTHEPRRRAAWVPELDADQKSGLPLGAHDEGDRDG